MPDENTTPITNGQGPLADMGKPEAQPDATPKAESSKTFDAEYVAELRDEAAKWRTQLRETQAQVKDLAAKAGSNEELATKLAALEADLATKAAAAETAQREAQLYRLASKAGVDPDVAALLDASKLDLSNEAETLEKLGKLAAAQTAQKQVKPNTMGGTGMTEDELRDRYFGKRSQTNIFGG